MKKLMFAVALCSAFLATAAAVEQGLQQAANDPSVAQMANEDPDGVQVFADGKGGFKLISVGRGTYDFTDEDEIADAIKEATRNAKAHMVKFFQENFKTTEDATNVTKKAKSLHTDGENETVSVSKETLKTTVENFHSDAQKVLSGIVVIKQQKVPSSKKGGKMLVTVGWSSLTQKVARKVDHDMTPYKPGPGGDGVTPGGDGGHTSPDNKPQIKIGHGIM